MTSASPAVKPESVAQVPASALQTIVDQLKAKPLIPLLGAGAIVLSVTVGLLLWAGSPEYRVIYSNLSENDGGRIISELDTRGIEYRIGQGGQTILVPANQVYSLRLKLAEQGLPQGGNVGFELLDNQTFGISQFAEHVNFQRGLEGELSRSIESLGPVAKARVHLVMAKNSVFARDRQPGSASVVLHLQSGREMGQGQIEAITHMVASSVPDLPAESVTVVDHNGRLLSKSGGSHRDLDGTQLSYAEEVERSYQRRIENILSPLLGHQNVKAQVVAQIDFSNREQTAERYGPNQPPNEAAIRSQQLTEQYQGDAEFARGVPGALTNSPPFSPAITTPEGGEKTVEQSTTEGLSGKNGSVSRDRMVNYEVDRSIEHVKHRRGGLVRLSAAVVINYRTVVDKEGVETSVPLTDEDMENINRLVRQAMGFSTERGDELAVINSPFSPLEEVVDATDWWKTPEFFNLVSTIARYLLVAFIGLLLWLIVMRPLVRKQREQIASQQAIAAAQAKAMEITIGSGSDAEGAEGDPANVTRKRKRLGYEHNLAGFKAMAKEDPRLVAAVFHNWINKP